MAKIQFSDALSKLQSVGHSKNGWHKSVCPAHADANPSLSFREDRDGTTIFHCFAGCSHNDIVLAIQGGATRTAEYKEAVKKCRNNSTPPWERVVEDSYTYQSESGSALFYKIRFGDGHFPKYMTKMTPVDKFGAWGLSCEPVLYRLPRVIEAPFVFFVEGEKDVKNMERFLRPYFDNRVAVFTNYDGAAVIGHGGSVGQKWVPWLYNRYLQGKHVFLWPDNDRPGHEHVKYMSDTLAGIAISCTTAKLPSYMTQKQDFTDWLHMGNTIRDFFRVFGGQLSGSMA